MISGWRSAHVVRWVRLAVLPAALLAVRSASAQTLPQLNPNALGNQQLRQQQRLEQQQSPDLVPQESPIINQQPQPENNLSAAGPAFQLNGVTFDKSAFLTPAELDAIASHYVGRKVDLAELQKLTEDVNALYQSKGLVTDSAIVRPQRVTGGVVHITLVEGRLGKADVQDNVATSDTYVFKRLPLNPGEVLDVPKLSDDTIFFNRTNDSQIRVLLQPGASFGQTDVVLAMQEPPRNSLDIFGDNEGVDSTGMWEGGGLFRRHSTLFSDDRFTAYAVGALGSFNGNFSYNLPIDVWGDRIGISYQRNHINIIQGPFQNLKISGWGQTGEVDFTHPVIATQQWLLTANLSASVATSKTDQAGFFVAKTTTQKATTGFSVTHSTAEHTITVSPSVSMARSRNGILDQSRYIREIGGTGRGFFDVGYDLSVVGLFGAQYSPQRLLPADQLFQIGGATTVRGYPVDALAGDSGYYLNGELHRNLDPFVKGLDAFAFYDWGSVFAVAPTVKSLESIGYGWDYEFRNLASFQFTMAFPLKNQLPKQDEFVIYARVLWHVF